MATRNAQLDWPLQEALNYPIRLVDEFEWERTLDGGGLFGDRNIRKVVGEAIGVVAAITPSNYPIEVILNKIGPALARAIPLCSNRIPTRRGQGLRLGRLIAEHTDFPAGVINVVTTPDNDVAGILATDPRVDLISFTGSTAVGKHLMREAAETTKRVFLELGGKRADRARRCRPRQGGHGCDGYLSARRAGLRDQHAAAGAQVAVRHRHRTGQIRVRPAPVVIRPIPVCSPGR